MQKFLFVLSLLSLTCGCEDSVETLCNKRFSEFQKDSGEVLASIESFQERRTLASENSEDSEEEEKKIDEQFEDWGNWSTKQLLRLQDLMSALDGHANLAEANSSLNLAANETVLFYGYAKARNGKELLETLQRVKDAISKVESQMCQKSQAGS